MEHPRLSFWIAIVTLLTAVISLAAAAVSLAHEIRAKAEIVRQDDQRKQQDRADERQKFEAESARLCLYDREAKEQIEQRFSTLMDDHGTLLGALKACVKDPKEENRTSCAAVICVGAAVLTAGKSDCTSIVSELTSIQNDLTHQIGAMKSDRCEIPPSPALDFLSD